MTDQAAGGKRIARNTALLYVRMMATMVVGLYTSRVVLNTLGVDDYGIYNVVGGVIAMFSFVNAAMSSATSRFLTFALGQGDAERLRQTFQTALTIHALIALFVLLVGETVGLWFLLCKMQIPPQRMEAAMWVYQLSVASAAVSVMSVPFNATIISHERMSAFAYISILEAALKLAVAWLLILSPFDKLKVYAVLLFLTQTAIQLVYMRYCRHHCKETVLRLRLCRPLFREMAAFAVWGLYGNLAYVAYSQGLNILLNVFFGPAINAARGIAVQVQFVVNGFLANFQTAMNPQITKSYAAGDIGYMRRLVFVGSKFSFYLLLFIVLPVLLQAPYVLRLWLVQVPPHTVSFLRILLLTLLLDTLSTPVAIATQATANIRLPQLVAGTILMAILPVSYVVLRLGAPAESVFVTHLCCAVVVQGCRVVMLRNRIPLFSVRQYVRRVVLPIAAVFGVVMGVSLLAIRFVHSESFGTLLLVCAGTVLINSAAVLTIGMDGSERRFLAQKLAAVAGKFKKPA